jgi:hypothetical protein
MELFLFLVFYLWIFGKLCYVLLLRMRNSHVLDLQCCIVLIFLVIPRLVYLRVLLMQLNVEMKLEARLVSNFL